MLQLRQQMEAQVCSTQWRRQLWLCLLIRARGLLRPLLPLLLFRPLLPQSGEGKVQARCQRRQPLPLPLHPAAVLPLLSLHLWLLGTRLSRPLPRWRPCPPARAASAATRCRCETLRLPLPCCQTRQHRASTCCCSAPCARSLPGRLRTLRCRQLTPKRRLQRMPRPQRCARTCLGDAFIPLRCRRCCTGGPLQRSMRWRRPLRLLLQRRAQLCACQRTCLLPRCSRAMQLLQAVRYW